jgi:hypothetical protein
MIAPFNYQILNEYKPISYWVSNNNEGCFFIFICFQKKIEEFEKTTINAIIQKNIEFTNSHTIKYKM